MTLNDLVQKLQGTERHEVLNSEHFPTLNTQFTGLAHDSRVVKKGDVFVVIPCDQAEEHALSAVQAGAVALIAEPDLVNTLQEKPKVPIITVASARRALSVSAALLYPGQPETMVAVTGTNGKSSVVTFVRQIWQKLGYTAASLGTLGVDLPSHVRLVNELVTTKLTTPDALSFHQNLNTLSASGITHCAFEASSHGLDQYRLHGVKINAAGFTNLSQDHLDYHSSMEDYFEAKMRLFIDILPPDKIAIINSASPYFPALKAMITGHGQPILSYAVEQEANLMAHNIRLSAHQTQFDLKFNEESWSNITLNMVGAFQIENVLCAMGLVIACGASASQVVEILPTLKSAPGRMELVGNTAVGSSIFIDYAHTPDALNRALTALRKHVTQEGRLFVVFGCGGNRDAGKRVHMGEVAHKLADEIYVTDDNPRDEDPAFIRAQILVGCPHAHEIADRRLAMRTAIQHMGANDIVLIAGKGHEQGQIIGKRVVPFDDRTVVQEILKEEEAA